MRFLLDDAVSVRGRVRREDARRLSPFLPPAQLAAVLDAFHGPQDANLGDSVFEPSIPPDQLVTTVQRAISRRAVYGPLESKPS